MTDVIVFIDALSPREVGNGFLDSCMQGELDAGVPRVTPRVMSSIYTGLPPEQNGMMEISTYDTLDVTRPKKSTFIEQSVREGNNVLCVGMPFCIPFQTNQDGSLLQGTAMGNNHIVPSNMDRIANLPAPAADMIKDTPSVTYHSFEDAVESQFRAFRESLRRWNFNVGILGIRLVDSYCHFQHTETRDGKPYRQYLIDRIDALLEETYDQIDGDIFFFSDHGQTELETTFRANLWLEDMGYLDYKIDFDFIDQMDEYTANVEQHPVDERVENQVSFDAPGVVVNEEDSKVVCDDPFDSCMTLLCDREEFDEEQFREDLMETGLYRSVDYKWEIYDEEAEFYEQMPHIIPDRAEGVFVSGNLHPDPIGMGWYRTGVHDRIGCFGSTMDLESPDRVMPEELHDIIVEFLGIDAGVSPLDPNAIRQFTDDELKNAYSDLRERMKEKEVLE